MPHPPVSSKDKLLKVLYEWRLETIAESVCVDELAVRVGIDKGEIQQVIEELLEIGYVKTGTPADPSQIATWVKITKCGRDYLREKALVD